MEQRFPRDLSERCAVLSPEKRRWFHGDRKFHPRMGLKWRSAMTEGIYFRGKKRKTIEFNPIR